MNNNFNNNSTNNPAFNMQYLENIVAQGEVMTVSGTVIKTAGLLLLLFASAGFVWNILAQGYSDMANIYTGAGFLTALILGFVIIFKRQSPVIRFLVPIYTLAEGFLLGNLSFLMEHSFPGVVQMAVRATFLCVAVMLALYKTEVIKVNDKFRSVIILAMITIFGIYAIDLLLSFFGIHVPMVYSTTPFGIGFSLLVVGILAFNLLLDFDFIEQASARMLPKHMEWYGAFGVMLSIIWLYVEILRLLAKMQRK